MYILSFNCLTDKYYHLPALQSLQLASIGSSFDFTALFLKLNGHNCYQTTRTEQKIQLCKLHNTRHLDKRLAK